MGYLRFCWPADAYVCTEMHMSWYMTAVATGITGHMGGRGLFMIELFIRRRLGMSDEGRS